MVLWYYDVRIEFVFVSRVYRVRLYTVSDRIFYFDWRVTEGGGAFRLSQDNIKDCHCMKRAVSGQIWAWEIPVNLHVYKMFKAECLERYHAKVNFVIQPDISCMYTGIGGSS